MNNLKSTPEPVKPTLIDDIEGLQTGERIVAMADHDGILYVATTNHLFCVQNGKLVPLPFNLTDKPPTPKPE